MIRIGRLPKSRWETYRIIRLEALKADSPAFGSSYEEEVKLPPDVWRERISHCIFAFSGRKPVGVVSLVFSDRKKTGHIASIYGFYVSRPHRGKGVGTMLMDEAIATAKRNRKTLKLELSVNPEFRAALAIYQKAGFRIAGRMSKELKVGRKFYDMLNLEMQIR